MAYSFATVAIDDAPRSTGSLPRQPPFATACTSPRSGSLTLAPGGDAPVTDAGLYLRVDEADPGEELDELAAGVLLAVLPHEHPEVERSHGGWSGLVVVEEHLVEDDAPSGGQA